MDMIAAIDMDILMIIGVVLLGLLFGSFITMASYRIPRGEEIIIRRSHCPHCNHNLYFTDLIPVFSWLAHKGACAYCKQPISSRYPIIEIVSGAAFITVYMIYGMTMATVLLWLVAICLMVMIIVDFEHYIIPDRVQLVLLPLVIALRLIAGGNILNILLGGIGGLAVGMGLRVMIRLWKKQEGLGLGDVKFLGIAGCALDPVLITLFLFLAGVIGIITALCWRLLGKGILFPFGPALAVSLFACLLIPHPQMIGQDLSRLAMILAR